MAKLLKENAENTIMGLRDEGGVWRENDNQVVNILIWYYEQLFTTVHPNHMEEALARVPCIVSSNMNDSLHHDFTINEMELAIKQMAPSKAPGLDGMPLIFYQKYWHVIGQDVTKGVLSCLNSGQMLQSINHTYITLIPKVKNPERVTEFRPICLCNVLYKIISKVLANCPKVILPHIISESQSAFVPGRLITDNVLVAFETLHHMHLTKIGREGVMAIKTQYE